MKKWLSIFCLLASAAVCAAQTTSDVKDIQVAKKQLRVGQDTSKYFTSTTHVISPASTHRQAPTAKAVYDYVAGFGWGYRNPNVTVGSANFTVFGTLAGVPYDNIRVLRNGVEYRVGTSGCSNCQVAFNTTTEIFTLTRAVVAGEIIQVQVYE